MDESIIKKLRQVRGTLAVRRIRVTQHPPGGKPRDITDQYEVEFGKATNALNKAVTILQQVESGR